MGGRLRCPEPKHTQSFTRGRKARNSHCHAKPSFLHCTERSRYTETTMRAYLENRASANRASYLANLQRTNTSTCSYNDRASPPDRVLTEANLEAANVTANCDALRIVGQSGDHPSRMSQRSWLEPIVLKKEQILSLSVVGYVLEQLQGKALPPPDVL